MRRRSSRSASASGSRSRGRSSTGRASCSADEPTAALDPANARAVVQLLVDLVRELDCGLLLVSHEPELAARCGLEPLELDWAVEAAAWRTRVTRAPATAPAAAKAAAC